MKRLFLFVLLCSLFCVSCSKKESDPEVIAMRGLVNRVIPEFSDQIQLERLNDTIDRYEFESVDNKIVIRGNNANSMAVGLNRYLKYYCHAEFPWFMEEALEMPATLPMVPEKVSETARVPERFFLNYCTFGYTMPWWSWEQWEHFIDWMAMNGINLPLAITGQESVWYEVWSDLGLTDEEIRSYFTGPAHLPWHRMQNIDRWGGPLPMSWLENQKALQQKIVARERELNMKPVLPGFAGHVPPCIKRIYPDAPLASLGDWAGFDSTCWCKFLDPLDPLYTEIQQKFIAKQTEFFGTDHIYGMDIFNEMIPPSWDPEYLGRVSRQVYESLESADPEGRWLEMTWLFWNERQYWDIDNRIEAYITSFPKERHLLLDYYCERQPIWERTNSYYGVPYIWCYLGNFGGNSMLAGNLDTVNARIERAFEKGGDNFVGIGSTLEGFDCNPFMYEYVFEKAWDSPLHQDVDAWVERLADQRAGAEDPNMRAAWKLLADSVYNKVSSPGQTVRINQRPTMGDINEYKQYYVAPTYRYNNLTLLNVLDDLLDAECNTRARHFDVVNITRQMLGNYFSDLYIDYLKAYEENNYDTLHQIEATMISILNDTDKILATESAFLVGRWIKDARAIGITDEDKDYFESNARNIITTWGEEDALLNEYASRAWAGLTETYYAYRWKEFFKDVNASIKAKKPFDEKAYHDRICKYEGQWWRERLGQFNSEPQGDGIELARQIAEKYRSGLEGYYKK
ncbi:MAG: alpha-N-acetylglucosaminidase [Bacteroidales bacterium]|nr:alpha-N-acetylglucosaminidase [Bacteroidales bacterium]